MIAHYDGRQGYDSTMCDCFCIGLISFMLKGKSLTDFINLFSPDHFKNNGKVILFFKLKLI